MPALFEPFSAPFMQRALLGGLMVGVLASYYGPFVVQRRMAFLGSGLAHAAFGGVALGIFLDTEPLWIAAPFTVLAALAIVWVRERGALADDTVIGVFFAVAMAFGMLLISLRDDFAGDAFRFLFGSILAVSAADLWVSGAVLAASIALLGHWPRWAYATFDRRLAEADRLPVLRDDYVLAALLAVTIVVSIKVVGIILASAFLVVPAAAGRLVARTFIGLALWSLAFGAAAVVAGLYASYYLDVPAGAVMVLMQGAIFSLALVWRLAAPRAGSG